MASATERLRSLIAKRAVYDSSDRVNFTSTQGYEHFNTPGRFYVSGKVEKEMFEIIQDAIRRGEEYVLPLNEFLPKDYSYSPLRFDLDRKVEGVVKRPLYTASEIVRVYTCVVETFKKLFVSFDERRLRCIVSTKPNRVVQEMNAVGEVLEVTKQGVHLNYPDMWITPLAFELITREVKKKHSDIDENVVSSRQWLVYGGLKSVDALAYKATHVLTIGERGVSYSEYTPSDNIAVLLSISEHRRSRLGIPVERSDLKLASLDVVGEMVNKQMGSGASGGGVEEEECLVPPEQEDIDFVETELDRLYGACELLERPKRFGGLCFVYKRLGKWGEDIARVWYSLGGREGFEQKWSDVCKRVVYTGLKKRREEVGGEVKKKVEVKKKRSVPRVVRLGLAILEQELQEKEEVE